MARKTRSAKTPPAPPAKPAETLPPPPGAHPANGEGADEALLELLAVPIPPCPFKLTPEKKGRPLVFEKDPRAWPRLITALRQGNAIDAAASYAGLSRQAFYQLLRKARRAKSGPFKTFLDNVEEARAVAEVVFVGRIGAASRLNWKAAAFMLAARNPRQWAPARRVAVQGGDFKGPAVFRMKVEKPRRPVDEPSGTGGT